MVDSEVTGRMPGSTGVSMPRSRRSATRSSYSDGLEEELRDAEVGQCQLGRQVVTVTLPVRRRGWPAGCAATPTEKPPMARASSTSSAA